jgi:hypothetical protein
LGKKNAEKAKKQKAMLEGLRRKNSVLITEKNQLQHITDELAASVSELSVSSSTNADLDTVRLELELRVKQINAILDSYKDLINNSYKLSVAISDFDAQDPNSVLRFVGRLKFFVEDLPRTSGKAGILIKSLEGIEYSADLAVQVHNDEDYDKTSQYVIDEVLRPHLTFRTESSTEDNTLREILLQEAIVTIKKKEN